MEMLAPQHRVRWRRSLLLALPAVVLGACTGIEPAIVGVGATAAETGVTVFTKGKVVRFEPARYDDALTALRAAAKRLALNFQEDELADGRARLVYTDDRTGNIVAVVESRTEHITMVQADVGPFGYAGLANLLVSETNAELSHMKAFITAGSPPPAPETDSGDR
jgi:hypothetical protein